MMESQERGESGKSGVAKEAKMETKKARASLASVKLLEGSQSVTSTRMLFPGQEHSAHQPDHDDVR